MTRLRNRENMRFQGAPNIKKSSADVMHDKICPKCKNGKAWPSRGKQRPQYNLKCSKCGEILS